MVKLNKIYTRTGDAGTTGLGTGDRVAKDDPRIAAYGTVDETNAIIGLVRQHLEPGSDIDSMLVRIQNDMFDLGADLCVPDRGKDLKFEPLRIVPAQVERLEREIDQLNGELSPLKSFILPGGSPASAYLHVARTVCRRAERLMVTLAASPDEPVSDAALKYINRLSDFLFVAGRYVNDKGRDDILWVPGLNR
ncbi:Cob(I)yrinic acid a,c-diamide adenosyltransferase [Candidatus Filomicrobium marinum]|uniref:Corrinoid adenosyltransferase n=2 Tax=Filomicrobium TaxID=119044 RepID=A0A0D6JCV1_9HYPH|nr:MULTISPECIES: cob(I)yrinic acid a,c-diamide adenosyltransferase [Filomicrobium]MCV0368416.1 cob(I)yrinic acid a,c-diamide adenosyltransferase [Filomicrobium sp.]CFX10958.1 Cob(I)yrinic acid a,c-diamide adenosyltransferase [Candidatus Filomicrobium marinum]CPR17200.1 Cob(I)yrinic acid a,c-diamide adenosyltransferase [Candidatus Filomicrobium marinum]SDO38172.1 ATP:cob(I)alamin adenosyltransferase [Filomicrobium insigne]